MRSHQAELFKTMNLGTLINKKYSHLLSGLADASSGTERNKMYHLLFSLKKFNKFLD